MQWEVDPNDPEIERRVEELGQQGLAREQIAVKLGMNEAQLAAREAADRSFCEAMWYAARAEVGWHNEQVRQARLYGPSRCALRMRPLPPKPASLTPHQPRWRRGGFY